MRKYAREVAFSKIYEFIMNCDGNAAEDFELFEEKNLDESDKRYVADIYTGVVGHFPQLSGTVSQYAKGFKLERVYKTDLAALTLALYEMDYTDTPQAVCVNEATEIAKKYSSEKSSGFVNGLLAGYIKDKSEKN